MHNTLHDIEQVLKLVKIRAEKINLFIADDWKYGFYKKLSKKIKESREMKVLMKELVIKDKEKEIAEAIKKALKDITKVPDIILDRNGELRILKENKKFFEEEFRLKFDIKEGNEKAIPGKVAILVE